MKYKIYSDLFVQRSTQMHTLLQYNVRCDLHLHIHVKVSVVRLALLVCMSYGSAGCYHNTMSIFNALSPNEENQPNSIDICFNESVLIVHLT